MDVLTRIGSSHAGTRNVSLATLADAKNQPVDLLATAALLHRPARAPNSHAELAAFCELSQILADDPRRAVRRVLEIALLLCHAGTAGISVLRPRASGGPVLHWEMVSGALATHEGAETPRNGSMCGLCLDAGTTILVSRPERAFHYLSETEPSMVEVLIVPLYDNTRRPLGTLWIAHHDSSSRFCSNDARMVQQLAIQLVLAVKMSEDGKEQRAALVLLEGYEISQRLMALQLIEERSRRDQAEASDCTLRQTIVFKDVLMQEVQHRVKNSIQIVASLLSMQSRSTASAEARLALQQAYARLHLLTNVHELLCLDTDGTQQILMPKLLQSMSNALGQSFAELSARVSLRATCAALELRAEDAIALALLANEATTNAYRHAFPNGLAGEIRLSLTGTPETGLILQITDTGHGMRCGPVANGLGLKLIHRLAEQLQGMLSIDKPLDSTGTAVILTIPPEARCMRGLRDVNERAHKDCT